MRPFLFDVQSWRDRCGLAAVRWVWKFNGTRNVVQAARWLQALDDGRVTP